MTRHELAALLASGDRDRFATLADNSPALLTRLVGFLYDADPGVRARAADALGRASAFVARRDPARVRRVLQRLVWALNDESGTSAWGAPLAIGEIARNDAALAAEFGPLLVSYLDNDEVALGTAALVQGTVHSIWRIAEHHPDAVRDAVPALRALTGEADATTRALAAQALERLAVELPAPGTPFRPS